MTEQDCWYQDIVMPALLRWSQRTYGERMRTALAEAGCDDMPPNGMFVVGSLAHAAIIREQLDEIGETARLILEPFGRDTAPAVTAALLECAETDEAAIAFVMPTDHAISDEDAFGHAAASAAVLARSDRLGLFGLKPSSPATGYGYIRPGAAIAGVNGAFDVQSFVEKPEAADAERLVAEGCLWNSGMFMMPVKSALVRWLQL